MIPTNPYEQSAWERLQAYTLSLGDEGFVHQHVVDAWTAQHADESTKAIGLTFALAGLYLHVEKGFSGRRVQRIHMAMARHRVSWPRFELPRERGELTVIDVLAAPAGADRDRAIDAWCASVWDTYQESHEAVARHLRDLGVV